MIGTVTFFIFWPLTFLMRISASDWNIWKKIPFAKRLILYLCALNEAATLRSLRYSVGLIFCHWTGFFSSSSSSSSFARGMTGAAGPLNKENSTKSAK